ncbi:MAG: accessory gene regulator B family protein, partial [Lachnospiraceae bacterium]|nr:accessory gene regulator B family protein [Lachnospiraceae bacterium]
RVIEGFLFYIIFCVTRLFCGGYHAKSYAGCKIVFLAALVVVLTLNEIPQEIFSSLWIILWSYYALVVIGFAPIENENKPLEETEKKKYKIISILLSFFWLAIEGLLYGLQSKFLRIIPITVALIATLMLWEINKKNLERRGKNEKRSKKEST